MRGGAAETGGTADTDGATDVDGAVIEIETLSSCKVDGILWNFQVADVAGSPETLGLLNALGSWGTEGTVNTDGELYLHSFE